MKKQCLALALVLCLCLGLLPVPARADTALENWNGQHTYGELKRFTDAGESAWFNSDGTNAVKEITAEQQ
ncbi:MAG: hypothetical protein K6G54_03725, partial [Oscillospiraceae bacterium]|nr:hypothetical protein [Oscillospiraceae bacterium]